MTNPIKWKLPAARFKATFLDIEDRCRAEALKAHEMVRDHAGLDTKRSRELEGQARFRMMEKGFQEVCELHGGKLLVDGLIPNTDLKVFQPFMRFENDGQGVILGLAAIPEPNALPVKNKSRLAGVTLNFYLSPRLDLDGTGPKQGDIFIVFLVSRDRERAGRLEEIAIGAISSEYDQYLYYESLEHYVGGFEEEPISHKTTRETSSLGVRLKPAIQRFIPPEAPESSKDEEHKKK